MNNNKITFILHKPQLSENIGACARAIKNFNFQNLYMIDPKPIFPNDKILATSVGAKDVINKSKVFTNLESSLGDIDILIATSARFRNKNVKHINLEDLKKIDFRKKIGFLFGSEASGLSNKEISYANYTLQIPTNINFKSLPNIDETVREIGVRVLNVPYSINRLSTQYMEIPLELRYRTQTKYPFRFYLGTKMGYMTRAYYNLNEENVDAYKRRNLDELDRLKYGVTFRVGYGLINLYTYYGLNGLMPSKRQKGINQLSFGISLMAN